jgi:hypothetical protein
VIIPFVWFYCSKKSTTDYPKNNLNGLFHSIIKKLLPIELNLYYYGEMKDLFFGQRNHLDWSDNGKLQLHNIRVFLYRKYMILHNGKRKNLNGVYVITENT